MCRLFGCRTVTPGAVAHELLHGANALRIQSREHPDGWGLGWYVGRVPQVVRSLTAAHGDEDFEEVSSFVTASTILAHIRKASIGRVALENTHPFEWGPWLFAHNGTVPEWEERRVRRRGGRARGDGGHRRPHLRCRGGDHLPRHRRAHHARLPPGA